MKSKISLVLFLLFGLSAYTQTLTPVQLNVTVVASGFSSPNGVYHAGDERLFILEKDLARIRIVDLNGTTLGTFLDLSGDVSTGGERGLLGLAFDPDYANNGEFYVNYTNNGGNTEIKRFTVSANPNIADESTGETVLTIAQPYGNHNGGHIAFGPDGYLYIGTGDGGSANDPPNNGQTTTALLGKMLRIDVSNPPVGQPYGIPLDNPFVSDPSTSNEIWAIGMRNPWKFSFDSSTGDLWIGDVGQNNWEEIDMEPAGFPGGANYGWKCYEGFHVNPNISPCSLPEEDVVFPVAEYSFGFCSITGGVVYRGSDYPGMYGHYVFSDYCNGRIHTLSPDGNGGYTSQIVLNNPVFGYVCYGEDVNHELYVININAGTLIRIGETCGSFNPTILSDGAGNIDASAGVNYWWYQDGVLIDGENAASFTPSSSGTYSCRISNGTCTRESNALNWTVASGISGCTYPIADNYDLDAEVDNGTCLFSLQGDCPADFNADGIVNTGDLNSFLSVFGSNCADL
jgi:glucose/arabinose dehydrogenase